MPKKKMSTTSEVAMPKTLSAKQLGALFVVWLVLHSIIVYFTNQWFPTQLVLGTHIYSSMAAVAYSMVVFTLIVVGAIPVVEFIVEHNKARLKSSDWMVIFYVVNTVGLWVVARFAEQLGMGISSWIVAAVLAGFITIAQGITVKIVTSMVR